MGNHWFGTTPARILLIFPLFAVFGTALAVVAVQGRLLFALACDNIAPGSRLLRKVNGHTKTPVAAILVGTLLSAHPRPLVGPGVHAVRSVGA